MNNQRKQDAAISEQIIREVFVVSLYNNSVTTRCNDPINRKQDQYKYLEETFDTPTI